MVEFYDVISLHVRLDVLYLSGFLTFDDASVVLFVLLCERNIVAFVGM